MVPLWVLYFSFSKPAIKKKDEAKDGAAAPVKATHARDIPGIPTEAPIKRKKARQVSQVSPRKLKVKKTKYSQVSDVPSGSPNTPLSQIRTVEASYFFLGMSFIFVIRARFLLAVRILVFSQLGATLSERAGF